MSESIIGLFAVVGCIAFVYAIIYILISHGGDDDNNIY